MQIAVLILAHKNYAQVNRLITKLAHPAIRIFVHADKKSNWDAHQFPEHTTLIKKNVSVFWGDFTPVEATLNGMKEIKESQYHFDYFILLSGQDYPIKPINKLLQFLDENKGREFIDHIPVNESGWKPAMSRYQYYHYRRNKNTFAWFVFTLLRTGMKLTGIKRKPPLPVWGGSQWFTISHRAFSYILDYSAAHPEYIAFMRKCNFTDEMFFQTLLLNAPFKEQCVTNNLRYINWKEGTGKKMRSPKIIGIEDYEAISQSDVFFARKFDEAIDSKILDKIDRTILENENP